MQIVKWGDTIVDVQLPTSKRRGHDGRGLKNAASTGQSKDATLETGAIIQVPLFVEIGDVVKVKCAEREFIERAKKKVVVCSLARGASMAIVALARKSRAVRLLASVRH